MKTMPKIVLALSALATFGVSAETYYSGQADAGASATARKRWRLCRPIGVARPHLMPPLRRHGTHEAAGRLVTRRTRRQRGATRGARLRKGAPFQQRRERQGRRPAEEREQGPPRRRQSSRRQRRFADRAVERRTTQVSVTTATRSVMRSRRGRDPLKPCSIARAARSHQARGLATVGEEDERRPELDAERPTERLHASVFHANVANALVRGQRRGDQRLSGATVAAPRGAELEQGRPGERVDRGAGRFAGSRTRFGSHRVEREAICAPHCNFERTDLATVRQHPGCPARSRRWTRR